MNIKQAISHYTALFSDISDTAHLDAECLIMHITNTSRAGLFSHPETVLTKQQENKLEVLAARRSKGEPIAYLTGYKEFWDLNLKVSSDVLIPRPETECLIEWILTHFSNQHALKVADLGVGSGAIALALAKERPNWKIHATDISKSALKIAEENAKAHKINNVSFFKGQWCEALPENDYDIIVSNPPYIPNNDAHLENLQFEPQTALAAGSDGLDAIKIIVHQAKDYLKKSGVLIFEHGYDQRDSVLTLLNKAGYKKTENHTDLAGQPRFSLARK